MNDLPPTVITFILARLLSFLWVYILLDVRIFLPVESIAEMNLVGGCQLQYYTPPIQSENTLVLSCPGEDAMRLWPLPVERLWDEGE